LGVGGQAALSGQESNMKGTPTTFLVVGCGSIGLRHLTCLAPCSDVVTLAADVRPETETSAKEIDERIEFFSDYEAALGRQPDIVIAATPNGLHADVAVRAFEAGAHVLSEKPIADTVANGRRMVEAAEKNGKVLAVGYTERYRPAFEFLEEMARNGEFGNLIGGRAMVGTYNTLLCAKTDFRSTTFGALIVDYTHEFDMLRSIFGEVREVTCRANSLAVKELKASPSLASILLEYESGALVSAHMDYVQHPQRRAMEIFGDRKVAEFNLQTDQVKLFDCDGPGHQVMQFESIRNERFMMEHQDLVDAIRTGKSPKVDGRSALKVLEIAESALDQLESG